ncbi:MAG: nucleotidyltransferase domain-containing protein [Pseudomonadota bacterium]
MTKDRTHRRDLMREQLAHHAARLMAEDGITDYTLAKRKAAKQLGAIDTQHLPSNQQVEEALRVFRSLYQKESHPPVLRHLREEALSMMRLLEPFSPYLTGSVLNGTAGEQSDINLLVYSDDEKAMLMFFLKHNLPFESGEWRIHLAGRQQTIPSFTLHTDAGVPVHIAVQPENTRHSAGRKPETHADIAALELLLRTDGLS